MSVDHTEIDTWLTREDLSRIWAVVHGHAPEIMASEDELTEFARVIELASHLKYGTHLAPEAQQ